MQRLGQLRMNRLDLLEAVLAQRVFDVRVHPHGPRPVQGDEGGDVLEVGGLHLLEQRPHGAAVELEHPEGVPAGQQVVGLLVGVEVEVFDGQRGAGVLLDRLQRILDQGEVAQPQEVHLDQAQFFQRRLVELGDDRAVVFPLHDRQHVQERLGGHDDAGRVHAPLPLHVLDAAGGLEHLGGLGVGLQHGAEVGALLVPLGVPVDEVVQRHFVPEDGRRHRLGELLPHRVGHAQHPGAVLERLLGLDAAVGDDLRDPVVAVLVGDVADHLAAAPIVEVDVDVGHGHALRVQEPLEDESVLDRVELGDPHGVRGHGAGGRASSRADADALGLGPADVVGHDEEVAGEAHLLDDIHLVLSLGEVLLARSAGEASLHPAGDLLFEPAGFGLVLRHREARHEVTVHERHFAAFAQRQRVGDGLRMIREQRPHLLGALEVELVRVEVEPVRVVEGRRRLHAQQCRVGVGVGGVHVVQVVGGQQRQTELFGQSQQLPDHPPLHVDAVVHDLAVEVVGAEDVPELGSGLARFVVLPQPQPGLDLATGASGGGDHAFGVFAEQFAVHPRFEVEALDGGQRGHLEEVVHPDVVFGEQRHVGVRAAAGHVVASAVAPAHAGAVLARGAGSDVGLGADDRLDSGRRRDVPEVVRAEHVAVVGHRDGRHPLGDCRVDQRLHPRRAIQHGVLAVHVQVHEGILAWRHNFSDCSRVVPA